MLVRNIEPQRISYGTIYQSARQGAAIRGIDFKLTREDFNKLVERANGCCMLTGIPFSAEKYESSNRRPFMPSVDRIDSAGWYKPENVRLVCVLANLALSDWGIEPLLVVARQLVLREPDLRATIEARAGARHARRWMPITYSTASDYVKECYADLNVSHQSVAQVSRAARQHCDREGIAYTVVYPTINGVYAYPRSVLAQICDERLVPTEGLEPPTNRLGNDYSIP